MGDIVLTEWTKGNGNIVRFKLYKLECHLRLGIREYFPVGDQWKPTRKGINLPARAADDLSKAAKRAVGLIERKKAARSTLD